jgi:hypothetical protein
MQEFFAAHLAQIMYGVFALFALLMIWVIAGAILGSKKRRANLREWAFRRGYDYAEGPIPMKDLAPLTAFEIKPPLTRADAYNVTRGSRATLFDLQTTKRLSSYGGSQNRSANKSVSCALFKLPEPIPRFQFAAIASENSTTQNVMMGMVKSLAALVADLHDMIPIEGHPGFILRAPNAEEVKPLFTEERVKFFDDKCGWTVDGEGSWLLLTCDPMIYQHGFERQSIVSEKNYDEFVRVSEQIYDHFRHSSS